VDAQSIKEGLVKALEQAQEGMKLVNLEEQLATGKALLWTGENGVLVTQLFCDESGPFLHVWLGTGDIRELLAMEPGISAWARARGCRYASINGRKGWTKVFKSKGFTMIDGELRKQYV
jgi:hypothetical protein